MKIPRLPSENSILLIGAGASIGAKGKEGGNLPTGEQFRESLCRLLGFSEINSPSLSNLATLAERKRSSELRALITQTFRVESTTKTQDTIYSKEWKRIYTTNYDDVIEFVGDRFHKNRKIYTFASDFPNKLPNDSIIHIHGYVGDIEEGMSLDKAIILDTDSYIKITASNRSNQWLLQLYEDMKNADAVYIVGYGFSDLHLQALWAQNEEFSGKTFFIQPEKGNEYFGDLNKNYGKVLNCGIEGFASQLSDLPKYSFPTELKCFPKFELLKNKQTTKPPTPREHQDLLTRGSFSWSTFLRAPEDKLYLVPFDESVKQAISFLDKCNTLLILGDPGSGKRFYLRLLMLKLMRTKSGCVCREFYPRSGDWRKEIRSLDKGKDLYLFLANYVEHQDNFSTLVRELPNAKFIIGLRTSFYDIRAEKISEENASLKIESLYIPEMQTEDINVFEKILRRVSEGTSKPNISSSYEGQKVFLRDQILKYIKDSKVANKLLKEWEIIKDDNLLSAVGMVIIAKVAAGSSLPFELLRSALGDNPNNILEKACNRSFFLDVLEKVSGEYAAKSSIYCEFICHEFQPFKEKIPENLKRLVEATATELASKKGSKNIKRIGSLLNQLMSFRNLRKLLGYEKKSLKICRELYGFFVDLPGMAAEPLFWLQMAILEAEEAKESHDQGEKESFLEQAWKNLERAYLEVEKKEGEFDSYQIDSQAIRVAVGRCMNDTNGKNNLFDDFTVTFERLPK